ncbi:hypothetical protein PSFL_55050 [Pseudomonas sp. DD1]|uniref:Scaffold protein n=1 Tax=Pseudomonas extremaustralis TaxID=359110 RepID=A0A5C5Q176_9PSED|nr:hypothetical protein [Pseudomonas extremaustralis]EZI23919.1 hypothetical protein PE143B_0129520 [Pseudomonas extremaustralis 14-3 substr. 14-3b]TWR98012.1 hypothetical protein FIV36_30045 [Pseudomonas extremaustralis]SDE61846.1 hypothetical protein SAMN05216591_0394 [Pseudomonas extremaustralis]
MGLKYQLDTLDGLDDSVKSLYTEKEGKFVLGIEGLPQPEDVSGLKSKVEELLGEKKAAEKARKDAEEQARLEREEAARKSGNVEELEKSWSEKYNRREAELNGMLEQERGTLSTQIRDLTVGRTATDIASALAIPGSAKALLPHIERRLSVEQRDGKPVVVVLDQQGKLSAATLEELKAEFANDTAFAPLIAGSKASGGGAAGAGGGGGAAKGKIGGTKEERQAAIASRFPDLPQS